MPVSSLPGFGAQAPRVLGTGNKKRWMQFPHEAPKGDTEGQVGCRWPDMRKNDANDKKSVLTYHRAVRVFCVIHSFIHSLTQLSILPSIYPPPVLPSIHPFIYHPSIHPSSYMAPSSPLSGLYSKISFPISPSQFMLQNFLLSMCNIFYVPS